MEEVVHTPVAKLISAYINHFGKDDICISLLGYMSTKD